MLGRISRLLRIKPPEPEVGNSGWLLAHGNTVPADGATGYATGCLFQHLDGGDGTALYVNEGDETDADFNAINVA